MQIIFDTDKDDARAAQALMNMVNDLYGLGIYDKPATPPPPPAVDTPAAATPPPPPAVDTPAAATPAADTPRDAAGVAWDARVHTSNQATKQDGTWKRKPGLDDAFYEGVMAELTAHAGEPGADTPAASEGADTPAAAAFASPPPPPATPAHTFLSNMQMITRKQLGKAAVDAELAKAGIEGVAGLVAASDAKQAEVAALLEAI